jgi:CRP-like cAMP-binding protein
MEREHYAMPERRGVSFETSCNIVGLLPRVAAARPRRAAMDEAQQARIGALLRKGEWFAGLPPPLQALILDRSITRSFAKGQVVQREDCPPLGLIAILEGQVSILRHVGDDEPALIHVAGPGFWFGDSAALTDEALVSAVAQTPVKALLLPKREFDRILAQEPRYYPFFIENSLARLRILLRYFAETVRLSPEYRLRLRLADLADHRRGETATDGPAVELDIAQAELAQLVGLSRQRLNRLLKALERDGWIELAPRRIRVRDPNGLRASTLGTFDNARMAQARWRFSSADSPGATSKRPTIRRSPGAA